MALIIQKCENKFIQTCKLGEAWFTILYYPLVLILKTSSLSKDSSLTIVEIKLDWVKNKT